MFVLILSVALFVLGIYQVEWYDRYQVYWWQAPLGYALVAVGLGLFLGLVIVSN